VTSEFAVREMSFTSQINLMAQHVITAAPLYKQTSYAVTPGGSSCSILSTNLQHLPATDWVHQQH